MVLKRTLRNKVGYSSMHKKVLCNQVAGNVSLWHDSLKFANIRFFMANMVYHKMRGFIHSEPIATKDDICRQSDRAKEIEVFADKPT